MKEPLTDVYLTNGNIAIFCGSHSDKFKNDILHLSLYSQLVAEKKSNNPESMRTIYTDMLGKMGWIINTRENQYIEFGTSNLFTILEQTAGQILPTYERQALTSAFSALKKLPRDSLPIRTIFNKLQANVSVVSEDTKSPPAEKPLLTAFALLTIVRNDKTVVTLQISFETTNVFDIDILDQPILKSGQEGNINFWSFSSSLDESEYNKNRDIVIKKLGGKIATDLVHIRAPAILDGNDQMQPDV